MKPSIQMLAKCAEAGKDLLIYGAGSQGRGLLRSLRGCGIEPTGFVDRNPDTQGHVLSGLTVLPPSVLTEADSAKRFFIIVATFFFEHEVSAFLEAHGFIRDEDYCLYSSLKPRDYAVEVSGICNLHCISCPRADRHHGRRNSVIMDLRTFEKVIAKIRREDPFVRNIQLYQWGEPTLNQSLPEMIRHAGENGILCTVSSNLNHNADFRALIEAHPECLRISVSGMEQNYEITHTGGHWHTFLSNAETLSRLRRELYPEMKVELYYHLYKHSVGAQEERMRSLCRKLDFEFHPVPAYIISLDDVLGYCEGIPLPEPARRARELLLLDIDEGLKQAKAEARLQCDTLRVIMINADLSVSVCMMFYDPDINTVADNYLETPLTEILERRARDPLCIRCRQYGLHRYCGIYARLGEEKRH